MTAKRNRSGKTSKPAKRRKGGGVRPPGGIRLFIMDVDGTLTDGRLTYAADGSELKSFHSRDGAGIRFLPIAGIIPAIVSGRKSAVVVRRAKELGIRHLIQRASDKAAAVRSLAARLGVPLSSVAFIGDDLSDIPSMREAGFSAAPADAAPETRRAATFVCSLPGGRGAVREAIETLLKREGLWRKVLATFGARGGPS